MTFTMDDKEKELFHDFLLKLEEFEKLCKQFSTQNPPYTSEYEAAWTAMKKAKEAWNRENR